MYLFHRSNFYGSEINCENCKKTKVGALENFPLYSIIMHVSKVINYYFMWSIASMIITSEKTNSDI